MNALLTTVISIAISIQTFACECPEFILPELDNRSYAWSDVVLIGNLVQAGDNYNITVSEVLKGEVDSSILEGLTSGDEEIFVCTFVPPINGKYLLYLKKTIIGGKTFYYSSECYGSRPINMEHFPVSPYTDELVKATLSWIEQIRRKK